MTLDPDEDEDGEAEANRLAQQEEWDNNEAMGEFPSYVVKDEEDW